MVTDPPYGVNYDPNWRNFSCDSGTTRVGKVLNDDQADWSPAWRHFPGDVAYVWHAALFANVVADSLVSAGFLIRSQIIWAKERLVLSRGNYHWRHEPCWYGVRKGAQGHWAGDRTQTTLWEIAGTGQDTETAHGTQKPVECMRRPMENNSLPKDSVYEPFCGSGTTIIAAEQTGRRCLAMELSPPYVDMTVQRWQNFTGKTAIHAGNNQTFDEIRKLREGSNGSA
jgi:DNA modification methylase